MRCLLTGCLLAAAGRAGELSELLPKIRQAKSEELEHPYRAAVKEVVDGLKANAAEKLRGGQGAAARKMARKQSDAPKEATSWTVDLPVASAPAGAPAEEEDLDDFFF